MRTYRDAKAMAKALREALADKSLPLSHSQSLEVVARQFGLPSWNVLSAKIDAGDEGTGRGGGTADDRRSHAATFGFEQAIPIVRIFDVPKAHDFYRGFLGFAVDWEHRFGDNFPLYTQISRAGLRLHLSEHSGDASPGGNMVVYLRGLRTFHQELAAKDYRYMKPGISEADWGLEMQVVDPFNNRIRFIERPG